ncbi:MAG: T9SS type A sorting domain-containing protein [Balneolaceae bacterium]
MISALLTLPVVVQAQVPAFPGAEGYGSYSKGGRGGKLLIVTNLNDSGPGSLRDAVEREGPRTILFEVGGIIDLTSSLVISDPYISIAGQSAPDPGITIRGHQLAVQTHDVVVRFIRFRPGDYLKNKEAEVDWASLDAVDIGLEGSDDVHDIIFDHCSFSWAMDENIGIWHNSKNITIQNSIISEGLHNPRLNPQTGKALLIGMLSDSISILKNLFAHNYERNPFMNANGHLDFRNNIIYNGGDRVLRFNSGSGRLQTVNLVNNVVLEGPESSYSHEIQIRLNSNDIYNGKIYAVGNLSDRNPRYNSNNWRMVINQQSRTPFPRNARSLKEFSTENTETLPPENLFEVLDSNIGATLPARDQVDERIIHDVEHKTGEYAASPGQLFGWPVMAKTYRKIDADSSWQRQHNINLFNPEEAGDDYNKNGYTNLEEFLNETDPHQDQTDWKRIGILATAMDFSPASIQGEGQGENSTGEEQDDEEPAFRANYPNPFNSTTNIPFRVKSATAYTLEVINSTGQRVAILASSTLVPGDYRYTWNADNYPSGVYFVRLSWPGHSKIQKAVLVK